MGLGLVTDDRSREEGRHYTYPSAVRLHGSGASDETKPFLMWEHGLPAMAILRVPSRASLAPTEVESGMSCTVGPVNS